MKLILMILSVIGLSSCLGGNNNFNTGLQTFSSEYFSLRIPQNWSEVSPANIPNTKNGQLVLAYSAKTAKEGYINNIVIIAEKNPLGETSIELAQGLSAYLYQTLQVFQNSRMFDVTFSDNDLGKILEFQGQYNSITPYVTYIQTVKKCDDVAYYINISVGEDLDNYERYRYLLSTFSCAS